MGLKEFKEKNVVNYDSLLKEYKRTKEVIRDKLKDLKKVSFKEFVDIFIQINEESLK